MAASADAFAQLRHRTDALVARTQASSLDGRRRVVQSESRLPVRSAQGPGQQAGKPNLLNRLSRTIFGNNNNGERQQARRGSRSSSLDDSLPSSNEPDSAPASTVEEVPAAIHRSRPLSRDDPLLGAFQDVNSRDDHTSEDDRGQQGSGPAARARGMINSLLPSRFKKGRGSGHEDDLMTSEAMWEKPMRNGGYSAIAPVPGGEGSAPWAAASNARGESEQPPPLATRGNTPPSGDNRSPSHDATSRHARLRRSDGQELSVEDLVAGQPSGADQVHGGPATSVDPVAASERYPQAQEPAQHMSDNRQHSGGEFVAPRDDSSSGRSGQDGSRRREVGGFAGGKHLHGTPQRLGTARDIGAEAFAVSPGSSDERVSSAEAASQMNASDVTSEARSDQRAVSASKARRSRAVEHQYSGRLHPLTREGWDSSNPLVTTTLAQELARQSDRLAELQKEVSELQAAHEEGAQLLEERLEDLAFAWDNREGLVDGALADRNGRGSSAVAALRQTLRQAAAEEALTQIRREGDSIVAGTAAQLALLESRVKRAETETLISAIQDIRRNLVQFLLTGTVTAADTLAPATVPPGLTMYGLFTVGVKQVAQRMGPLLRACGCGRGAAGESAGDDDSDDDAALLDFGHAGGEQRKGRAGDRRGPSSRRTLAGGRGLRSSDPYEAPTDGPRSTPRRAPGGYSHPPSWGWDEPMESSSRGDGWDTSRAPGRGAPPQWQGGNRPLPARGGGGYGDDTRHEYGGSTAPSAAGTYPDAARGGYDPKGPPLEERMPQAYHNSPPEPLPRWGGPSDTMHGLEYGHGMPPAPRIHHRIRTAPVAGQRVSPYDEGGAPAAYPPPESARRLADDDLSAGRSSGRDARDMSYSAHDDSYAYESPREVPAPGGGGHRPRRPPPGYGTYPPRSMLPPTDPGAGRRHHVALQHHHPHGRSALPEVVSDRHMRLRRDPREHRAGGVGDVQSVHSADSRAHDFDGIE